MRRERRRRIKGPMGQTESVFGKSIRNQRRPRTGKGMPYTLGDGVSWTREYGAALWCVEACVDTRFTDCVDLNEDAIGMVGCRWPLKGPNL